MDMSNHNLSNLTEELGRSLCHCGSGQRDLLANDFGLCRTLIRLLCQGKPVSAEVLAQASGCALEDVLSVIEASSNVELDDEGRIVGAGLSLQPTPHRLTVDGRQLYAWCALDALMYPPLLDMVVQVESPCAATGIPIRARVSATGVAEVAPAEAVVSVVKPAGKSGVRLGFCNHVHFFRTAQAAGPWLKAHPEGYLLPVAEAFDLGRQLIAVH